VQSGEFWIFAIFWKKVDAEKLAQKTEQTPGNSGRVGGCPTLLGSEWHAQ
jgi:hypothetical protein